MIHCNECDICIKDYDHHCPWTGKCIGKANLSGFYVFFFASCALIFVCFAAIIASIWLLETEWAYNKYVWNSFEDNLN